MGSGATRYSGPAGAFAQKPTVWRTLINSITGIFSHCLVLSIRQKRNLKKILDRQEESGFVPLKIPMPPD